MTPLSNNNLPLPDAAKIKDILLRCGSMLLDVIRNGNTGGVWQGEQYKAVADALAHEFLVSELNSAFPDIPVVSEEDGESISRQYEYYFIIDPIDGTASFAHGFTGWVTQIAYIWRQQPLLAGIYAPASNEYFAATYNQGSYCNDRLLCLNSTSADIYTIIDNYPEPRGIALETMDALGIPEYIESGSISLKICRIADSSADLFLKNMQPRDWDIAAPMLVLQEACGVITDISGKNLVLGTRARSHLGLIATKNATMLDKVLVWLNSRDKA